MQDQIRKEFNEADQTHDRMLSFEEFIKLFEKGTWLVVLMRVIIYPSYNRCQANMKILALCMICWSPLKRDFDYCSYPRNYLSAVRS